MKRENDDEKKVVTGLAETVTRAAGFVGFD